MNKSVSNKKQLTNLLLIVIAILLIALGFYHLYERNQYIKNGEQITAVVVNVLMHPQQAEGQTEEEYKKELERYNDKLEDYKRQGIIKETSAIQIFSKIVM